MIYKTIDTADQLREEFIKYDRDYYSLDGYQAMIDLFEETETNHDLDVIALCCDFNEDTFEEFINNYSLEDDLKELCEDEEPTEDDYKEVINNYIDYNGSGYAILLEDTVFYSTF